MTSEEFEGHLMACLHGPNADKIAERIFVVALANEDIAKALSIVAMPEGSDEALFDLAVLAHLSAIQPGRGDTVLHTMERLVRKSMVLKRVRSRLASAVREHPDAERIAAAMQLDLAAAEQPTTESPTTESPAGD